MKDKIKYLAIGIIFLILLYGAMSFFNLSIDPRNWGAWSRGIFAYTALIDLCYLSFIVLVIDDK